MRLSDHNVPKSKATIYEVASRAGVGISTVSRVLNDSPRVASATRARVLDTMKELNFRPDRLARSLAQQSSRYLAVAIPSFTTPFHTELLKGVRRCLRNEEIDLLLCDLGSRNRRKVLTDFLRRGTSDGLLLVGVDPDIALEKELTTLGSPVVLVGGKSSQLDTFRWDDLTGAKLAVRHLVDTGHTRVGLIRTNHRSHDKDDRFKGYRDALTEAGLEVNLDCVVGGMTSKHRGYSEEFGYEAMQKLLDLDEPVTAVFACSDVQALGAWRAILDAGKRIPEDVALVGYDNLKSSYYWGLSTVDQHMGEIGEAATRRLLSLMRGDGNTDRLEKTVIPDIVIRRSSQRQAG